jgi:hypothetical protein
MSDLEAFKAQLDIMSIAAACTDLERNKILCPEHDDSTPSCQLYPLTNSYFCWTCKASGDVLKLVMLLRNLSLPEAIDWISETTGVNRPARDPGAEAQSIALKALRAHLVEALEALPEGTSLPGDLTVERARALGMGFAHNLAGVVESSPRRLLTDAEIAAWEGGWTLELYGRGGGHLGFGAFLPLASAPAQVEEEPELEGEPAEEYDEAQVDPAIFDEDSSGDDAQAPTDTESLSDEEVIPDDEAQAAAPAPTNRQSPVPLPSPELGRWVKAASLRSPGFAGLPLAREVIARHKAVALSPDLAVFIEMSAAGFPGLIAPAGVIDSQTATAIASLAPEIIVVVSPAYRRSPGFLADLWALAATGASVKLVPHGPDGLGERLSLFEYLAAAAAHAHGSERAASVRPLIDRYLAALPSRSTREIYTAELRERNLL